MKTFQWKYVLGLVLIAGIVLAGCKEEEEPPVVIPEANEVNKFIYNGLHDYYLWNGQIDALNSTVYASSKDSLNKYLNTYDDPEELFTSLLYRYGEIDKWSFLVDDSKTIDDWIAGISETMGYDFMLYRFGSANDLFGVVRYVLKGSPADKAGIKRGDIFTKINETQLTIANYQQLLFTNKTYIIGMATITGNVISPSGVRYTMTAVEIQENPVYKDTIFTANNQKVGYLVYNGFTSDFDLQLNDVIKKFKDAKIDQMVLDLRYNGGGSVQSSIYLASMLYGTDPSKVFAKSRYNSLLQEYLTQQYGANSLNDYFTNTIEKTEKTPATPINTLNLQKIYILVSENTASASELLVNGLRPYMNVKVIGTNTNGKYTGSTTIKDWDENGNVNPNHKYAMQPIIVKYANSAGVSDYVDGLVPDVVAEENIAKLLPFGDPNESLLKIALDDMKGVNVIGGLKSAQIGLQKVAGSQDFDRFGTEMYVNLRKNRR